MNKFGIIGLANSEIWSTLLDRLNKNKNDIFFTPEYYRLYEERGDGIAQCLFLEEGNEVALYPFLLNSVNKIGYDLTQDYYDIQGAYGYNGIITNSSNPSFLKSFFDCIDTYCIENNIIAEFIRINPLMENPLLLRAKIEHVFEMVNININLLNENLFDLGYEYSTRKNIKKAIRSGLSFKYIFGNQIGNEDLKTFISIYNHTMRRNNAEEFYFFDNIYFKNISAFLKEKALFGFIILNDQIISSELVLLDNDIAYSFLGGTLEEFYEYRPNDFLKHKLIMLLKDMGLNNFLLGGGGKGVLRYKKSFSKFGEIPFYIAKRIHNKEVYEEVVTQWNIKCSDKVEKYGSKLLKYRF